MKNSVLVSLAIAGLSASVGTVSALPILNPVYQDIDSFGVSGEGILLNAGHTSQPGTFDITSSDDSPSVTINSTGTAGNRYLNAGVTYNDILGFQPGGSKTIVSAYAYFYIRNANGNNDVVSFDLNTLEFGIGSSESRGNASHIIFGGGLDTGAIDVLNNNGELSYTVERDGGSFTLDYAQLQVVTVGLTGQGDPVPDGGSTAGMLGCAFLLTGVVARRLKS